ncbi:unnamed protein product [Cuscuta epithymum]|uniref:Glycosyltransferase n=1 Tax=Cuscuta epithymum TaxID=186058 RepID=A0AAV0FMW8_9ASTE|nr:unnamed protein product [Cuscuta epithymum]
MELVFIPTPIMGHIVSAVELAKHLINGGRDDEAIITTVTILILQKRSFDAEISHYIQSQTTTAAKDSRHPSSLKFESLTLPPPATDAPATGVPSVDAFKPQVRDWVSGKNLRPSGRLTFVVDFFCTAMVDVGNDFGIPTYVLFTSGAATLGVLIFSLQTIQSLSDHPNNPTPFIKIPTYRNPFPAKCLPPPLLNKDSFQTFLGIAERIRGAKGVLVNTFLELESHAVNALNDDPRAPPIYPIGPLLNLEAAAAGGETGQILEFLDGFQEQGSVLFLCFGSMARFGAEDEEQVKEIATALERNGQRFLWAFRSAEDDGGQGRRLLPDGFLERTEKVGKVVNGWVPQVAILAHPAVGGFISHCGWNSTLESLWFGKPIGTWPIGAEQEANAFLLVKEIGAGVEIKLAAKKVVSDGTDELVSKIVPAAEIQRGIAQLMDPLNPVRQKAKELGEKSRRALTAEGGSSYTSLRRFVQDAFHHQQLVSIDSYPCPILPQFFE